MKSTIRVLVGAVAVALAGCAATPPADPETEPGQPPAQPEAKVQPPPPAPRPTVSESDILLAYFDNVRRLSAPELARETELVRKLYAKTRTDMVRMRYAILLAAAPGAPVDEPRIVEILDPVLKGQDTNLRALATLVGAHLQEQRRAQGLQQKLDALMSLDKTMIERGSKAP
jgi:hypothetical protein